MTSLFVTVALSAAAPMGTMSAFNLSNYTLSGQFALPAVEASEASAVTWNWDTDTLFVVGDEGESIVQVSKAGALISSMSLTGFDDTEGLTYLGGGRFAIVEERIQSAYEITFAAGGTVDRSSLNSVSFGPDVGNIGTEGVCFDPITGGLIGVKEKSPQRVFSADVDFGAGTATTSDLFDPAGLGVLDISDVQTLTSITALAGTMEEQNLLLYSQESRLLMEVSRTGDILSAFDFTAIAGDAEGVTVDADGVIYIVGETPTLYVLTPIPAPSAAAMLGGAAMLAGMRRRR